MLLENVLDLFPCGTSSCLGKLAYSINDPITNPEIKSAALFLTELGAVFPDTICRGH
jgi:hypothetical protein